MGSSRCFKKYSITDTIDSQLNGDVISIVLPLGWVGLGLFGVSVVMATAFVALGRWRARQEDVLLCDMGKYYIAQHMACVHAQQEVQAKAAAHALPAVVGSSQHKREVALASAEWAGGGVVLSAGNGSGTSSGLSEPAALSTAGMFNSTRISV